MIYEILPINNYKGNNNSTKFDFDFYIENETQLKVYHFNKDKIKTLLECNVDYSIHEIAKAQGSYITFPLEGSKFKTLADDENISLELTLPISQETQYNNSSLLNLSELEYSFDYLTRLIQILARKLELCVKVSECSDVYPEELMDEIDFKVKKASEYSASCQKDYDELSKKYSNMLELCKKIMEVSTRVDDFDTKLNRPFFFGQSQYFETPPNNASWLKSAGQWNTKVMYPDFYNWILEQYNAGLRQTYGWSNNNTVFWTLAEKPSVGDDVYGFYPVRTIAKVTATGDNNITVQETYQDNTLTLQRNFQSDEENYIAQRNKPNFILRKNTFSLDGYCDDYDYIINIQDETFRLPLLNGNETIPSTIKEKFSVPTVENTYRYAPYNCFAVFKVQKCTHSRLWDTNTMIDDWSGTYISGYQGRSLFIPRGHRVGTYHFDGEVTESMWVKAVGNGSLYYYAGEAVKNLNIIDTGKILEGVNQLRYDIEQHSLKPHIISTYVNGSSGYNIYSNGYCEQWGIFSFTTPSDITLLKTYKDTDYNIQVTDAGGAYYSFSGYRAAGNKITIYGNTKESFGCWCTKGYLAQGQY